MERIKRFGLPPAVKTTEAKRKRSDVVGQQKKGKRQKGKRGSKGANVSQEDAELLQARKERFADQAKPVSAEELERRAQRAARFAAPKSEE